jgi:hypothetical protein
MNWSCLPFCINFVICFLYYMVLYCFTCFNVLTNIYWLVNACFTFVLVIFACHMIFFFFLIVIMISAILHSQCFPPIRPYWLLMWLCTGPVYNFLKHHCWPCHIIVVYDCFMSQCVEQYCLIIFGLFCVGHHLCMPYVIILNCDLVQCIYTSLWTSTPWASAPDVSYTAQVCSFESTLLPMLFNFGFILPYHALLCYSIFINTSWSMHASHLGWS